MRWDIFVSAAVLPSLGPPPPLSVYRVGCGKGMCRVSLVGFAVGRCGEALSAVPEKPQCFPATHAREARAVVDTY